ncbi:MAG: AAA family ATPase [Acidilobaceae archaeon]
MLYSISVADFRGIKGLNKPLELSKFTVLVGPSGSGKTSLLESLFLVPPLNTFIPLVHITKAEVLGGKHRLCPSLVYRYRGIAKLWGELKRKNFEFLLKCESKAGWPEVSGMMGNIAVDLPREGMTTDTEEIDEIAERLELELEVHPSNINVYIPNSLHFLALLEKELAKEDKWTIVERSGLSVKAVQELIDKGSLNERYTDITIRRTNLALRKETPRTVTYVYLYDLGEGLARLLLNRIYLEIAKPSIVLWDMVEAGLSPSLVRLLLDFLFSGEWQVVLTTHSLDVLRYIAFSQKNGVKVIQLSKGVDDTVKLKEISTSELAELLNKGIDPRHTVLT